MAVFHTPVRIHTGDGCLAQLGREATALGQRALVVCGASAKASGTLGRSLKLLRDAGLSAEAYGGVSGEPGLKTVAEAIALARESDANLLVGLGGGSAIDVAKATAALAPAEAAPRDYFSGRELDAVPLPWIAIPTTAGTGAEVTYNAVLIDEQSCQKKSIRGEAMYARVALVDPELTLSMSARTTAQSGADALCQAIEPFVSIGAMPVTDALCREAITLIGRSLEAAYADGSDISARRDMLYGSLMAGMALANARLGAVHGMAHPLGCRHHLAHGMICGLLLPYVMEWNLSVAAPRYAEVAGLLGVDTGGMSTDMAAAAAVGRVREVMAAIGIPETLGEAGARDIDIKTVARESMSASLKHNPRPMTEEDVAALLYEAL